MGTAYAVAAPPLHIRRQRLGYLSAVVTIMIWAGFALSIRAIEFSTLLPADVALLRFGIPTLVLLPFLPARLAKLTNLNWSAACLVLIGAGLPFFFLASAGGARSSSAHVGALIAGTVPISVAALSYVLFRQRVPQQLMPAFALIIVGVVALSLAAAATANAALPAGIAILLCASLFWALYTLGLRQISLDPIGCTLLLAIPSLIVLGVLCATGVMETTLFSQPLAAIAPFALVQGLGVGVIASLTYTYAIQTIGAPQTAIFGSLAPALTAAMAWPLFGEPITLITGSGVLAITCGVLLNSVLSQKGSKNV